MSDTVLVTGGAGFLGRRLAASLLERGARDVLLADVAEPPPGFDLGPNVRFVRADLSEGEEVERLVTSGVSRVFHFGAVVSSAAEADFDLGLRVNLNGTRNLLEACRGLPAPPTFVFAGSCASFGSRGGELPSDSATRPESSYGAQKAIGELLVNDYARKGFVKGVTCRLPTVVVRPGKPNLAASSFVSSIIREPLKGERATCPVSEDVKVWVSSARNVIAGFLHAEGLAVKNELPTYRVFNLPGITLAIREMLDALVRSGGDPGLVDFLPDPAIDAIVSTWPSRIGVEPELARGFPMDENFSACIEDYLKHHGA